jgi:hypothetical protein
MVNQSSPVIQLSGPNINIIGFKEEGINDRMRDNEQETVGGTSA